MSKCYFIDNIPYCDENSDELCSMRKDNIYLNPIRLYDINGEFEPVRPCKFKEYGYCLNSRAIYQKIKEEMK